MSFINKEIDKTKVFDGLERKILAHGGGLMTVECYMEEGVEVKDHTHIHEQCGYILSGVFLITIEDKEYKLETGDSYYVCSNQRHGMSCITAGKFLDIFTPQREDFK